MVVAVNLWDMTASYMYCKIIVDVYIATNGMSIWRVGEEAKMYVNETIETWHTFYRNNESSDCCYRLLGS